MVARTELKDCPLLEKNAPSVALEMKERDKKKQLVGLITDGFISENYICTYYE